MQFSTAFALIFHACSASGALASSDHTDPAWARRLKSAKSAKADKGGKSKSTKGSKEPVSRRAYLEGEFPCLGPLASEAMVAAYTEKENTSIKSAGIVLDVWKGTDDSTALSWFASNDGPNAPGRLDTRAGQEISKSEATLLCVTKCEELLEGCTLFRLDEIATVDGEVHHRCFFYGDATATAQFPVANLVGGYKTEEGVNGTTAYAVFHKGEELALPAFHGCDVPLGDAILPLIGCRVEKFAAEELMQGVLSPDCEDLTASASDDFEAIFWPGIKCTFEGFGYNATKLEACLGCLTEVSRVVDSCGGAFCAEDSFITKKCSAPETCTADGKISKNCCGDVCPTEEECVSKIATSLLCQFGAVPRWDADGSPGGCMNSDTPGHFTYLADSGNGDYTCP